MNNESKSKEKKCSLQRFFTVKILGLPMIDGVLSYISVEAILHESGKVLQVSSKGLINDKEETIINRATKKTIAKEIKKRFCEFDFTELDGEESLTIYQGKTEYDIMYSSTDEGFMESLSCKITLTRNGKGYQIDARHQTKKLLRKFAFQVLCQETQFPKGKETYDRYKSFYQSFSALE